MGLNSINIKDLTISINEVIKNSNLFDGYELFEQRSVEIKSPTVIFQYDNIYINKLKNRWLFLRIEDYFKNQRIIIWINKLEDKDVSNLDVENYFIKNLNKNKIKQKMIFSVDKLDDFQKTFRDIVQFIEDNSDEVLKNIFNGSLWIKQNFDWNGYK
jgi:uncharacterized ubiquitin-like protein YukD